MSATTMSATELPSVAEWSTVEAAQLCDIMRWDPPNASSRLSFYHNGLNVSRSRSLSWCSPPIPEVSATVCTFPLTEYLGKARRRRSKSLSPDLWVPSADRKDAPQAPDKPGATVSTSNSALVLVVQPPLRIEAPPNDSFEFSGPAQSGAMRPLVSSISSQPEGSGSPDLTRSPVFPGLLLPKWVPLVPSRRPVPQLTLHPAQTSRRIEGPRIAPLNPQAQPASPNPGPLASTSSPAALRLFFSERPRTVPLSPQAQPANPVCLSHASHLAIILIFRTRNRRSTPIWPSSYQHFFDATLGDRTRMRGQELVPPLSFSATRRFRLSTPPHARRTARAAGPASNPNANPSMPPPPTLVTKKPSASEEWRWIALSMVTLHRHRAVGPRSTAKSGKGRRRARPPGEHSQSALYFSASSNRTSAYTQATRARYLHTNILVRNCS
ncbi:hypothetical protein DFH09DRAFT_1281062 [Mycena vulgaris]|nr:hypothetical protein DFH09DRAFT_1281062 [Mycena vulgaris]